MKPNHFLCVLFFILISDLCAQKKDTVVVAGIFSHDSLINLFPYGTVKGKVIEWKPTEKQKIQFKGLVSTNGFCYIQYQHVLNLDGNHSFMFFRTDRFAPGEFTGNDNYQPVVGFAHLRRDANGLKVIKFEPFVLRLLDSNDEGYMRYADLDFHAVKYERRSGEPGVPGTVVDYYDLKNFAKLFSVVTFETNEGKVDYGGPGYFEKTISVSSVDKNTVELYTHLIKVDPNGEPKETSTSRKIKIYDANGKVISKGVYR